MKWIMLVLIAGIGVGVLLGNWYGYQRGLAEGLTLQANKSTGPNIDEAYLAPLSTLPGSAIPTPSPATTPVASSIPSPATSPQFSCDGRQHCSQMRSLAEAQFFLANCPNTKMDGDHDGRPCEQQFGF